MFYQRYKKIAAPITDSENVSFLKDLWGNYIVSTDLIEGILPWWEVESAIKNEISERFFKIFLLHDDETIKEDITDYIIIDGVLEKTYAQGQTRSLSIKLINTDKIWNPSPISGKLWHSTKFKLIMGIQIKHTFYWVDEGVFVCQNPDLANADANKIVTVQLYDKFALFDGTVNGTTDTDFLIPRGTYLEEAFTQLIRLPKNNFGQPLDPKKIIFPSSLKNEKTTYTIKKTSSNTIGAMLTDLADMISCDIFYDGNGYLNIRKGQLDLNFESKPISWEYSSSSVYPEFGKVNMKIDWSKIKNIFVVVGGNSGSGFLYKGRAENNNPRSAYNVNSLFGTHVEKITDSQIGSSDLCEERARYELKKNAAKYIQIQFESIYIPHLLPNDLIRWTFEDYDIYNELFLVQSVSVPLKASQPISVSFTNIKELPL